MQRRQKKQKKMLQKFIQTRRTKKYIGYHMLEMTRQAGHAVIDVVVVVTDRKTAGS